MRTLAIAVAVVAHVFVRAASVRIWSSLHDEDEFFLESVEWKNRRLQSNAANVNLTKSFVELHLEDLAALSASPEDGVWSLEVLLPSNLTTTCDMVVSRVLPAKLLKLYDSLRAWDGVCEDGSELQVNLDISAPDSMSAMLRLHSGELFYVDSTSPGSLIYIMYRVDGSYDDFPEEPLRPESTREAVADFNCEVEVAEDEEFTDVNRTRRDLAEEEIYSKGYKFRLALIANKQFSKFHGNTKASVLNSFVVLLSRMNGIYVRELGVFFQLIDKADKLICLDNDSCSFDLPNDSSLINVNSEFIKSQDISSSEFDLGHSVSTASGGVAAFPSLCVGYNSARGTTGIGFPVGDPFVVDYVSHEIGHQLYGAHSFRDCGSKNIFEFAAVEPGSGSTILGYAGICGPRNLQRHSDPILHPKNLEQMRNFIERRVEDRNGLCGEQIETNQKRPRVMVQSDKCIVPVGNQFQLRGAPENYKDEQLWYSWDRVDTGYEKFLDEEQGRFRTWMPTRSSRRDFPNLYYQLYERSTERMDERLPAFDGEMTFRFTARRAFSENGLIDTFGKDKIGDFGFADVKVDFSSSTGPLKFKNAADLKNLVPYEMKTFKWEVAGTDAISPWVEILIARHNMKQYEIFDGFDFANDVKEPDWHVIGVVQNSGSAELSIPMISPGERIDAHLMIRSAASDNYVDTGCYFFDFLPWRVLKATAEVPTPRPTFGSFTPTMRPTEPTLPPSLPTVMQTFPPTLNNDGREENSNSTSGANEDVQGILIFVGGGAAFAAILLAAGLFVLYRNPFGGARSKKSRQPPSPNNDQITVSVMPTDDFERADDDGGYMSNVPWLVPPRISQGDSQRQQGNKGGERNIRRSFLRAWDFPRSPPQPSYVNS